MPKFISDAEMEKLTSSGQSDSTPIASKPKFISDEQMDQMSNNEHIKAHENDGFIDKVKDPARWQAILNNTGPYSNKDVVAGTPPLVIPGSALPKLAQFASTIANGEGLSYAIARTGMSAGQGAIQSLADTKDGESISDKIDRSKEGATLSGGIQLAAESIPYIGKAIKAGGNKVGSALTGVSENLINNYGKRTDAVNDLIKSSGGDVTTAADQVRTELSSGIQNAKKALNNQISKGLENSDKSVRISADPIIEALEKSKSKLNPNFKSSEISEIDDMIEAIKAQAKSGRSDGGLDAKGLYEVKKYLNEASSSSYLKDGQMFSRAGETAQAAKNAANEARSAIKEYSPEISDADQQLSKLHQIEGRMNKNILAPGKPDGALFAAGAGANPRNAATLRELEKISGVPVSQRVLDLATAKEFANPKILPKDATGKTLTRMALGAAGGYLVDGNEGAVVGSALASPVLLKAGINAANIASQIAEKSPPLAKLIRENPTQSQALIQMIASTIRNGDRQNEEMNKIKPSPEPEILNDSTSPFSKGEPNRNAASLKGEDKWASDGMNRLGLSDNSLLSDKKSRSLLIEASGLKPGSKRFEQIKNQLSQGRGNK